MRQEHTAPVTVWGGRGWSRGPAMRQGCVGHPLKKTFQSHVTQFELTSVASPVSAGPNATPFFAPGRKHHVFTEQRKIQQMDHSCTSVFSKTILVEFLHFFHHQMPLRLARLLKMQKPHKGEGGRDGNPTKYSMHKMRTIFCSYCFSELPVMLISAEPPDQHSEGFLPSILIQSCLLWKSKGNELLSKEGTRIKQNLVCCTLLNSKTWDQHFLLWSDTKGQIQIFNWNMNGEL